ncbi:MAG: precorrin-6y C5,15-methyltransferase (decarboxylating) subunit CbiE [Thermodesulfobacteriota bacterium]
MSREHRNPIHVVGTGLDPTALPLAAARIVAEAEVLVGGDRLLLALPDHPAGKIPVRAPVSGAVEAADRENRAGKRVVVLADGDPGFFGIGKQFVLTLGADRVLIHPNVSILQAAAARIKTPWEDIRTVSLHGRKDIWPLRRAMARRQRVGVYTDAVFTPARIASDLQACGVEGYRMHVFEDMGTETERVRTFEDLKEAPVEGFSRLAFVILEPTHAPVCKLTASMDDDNLLHKDGLITKQEVRAVGLGLLGIEPGHVVWDLGAGSGAVALEASALAFEGMVFAVERDPVRFEIIRSNIRKTGAYAVEPVQGEMPGCLDGLPDPDRIFLGGGVRREEVLEAAMSRLLPGGRVLAHVVLLGSLEHAVGVLRRAGWAPAVTHVQVGRSRPLAEDLRLTALNPVFAVSAEKPV